MVLVQSRNAKAGDPAFKAAVADVTKTVSKLPVVTNVAKPQISEDKHSALVQFDLKGDPETAEERVGPVLDATAAVAKRHSALTVEQFGDASSSKAFADKAAEEEGRSMMTTLGSTLVILFIVFGALVAAAVPLILAVTAVFGTGGLVAIASQFTPMDSVAQAAILLIGLAVGVDYSLFYIRRMREERAKGHDKLDAIDIAAATSGRAVLLSGLTVMAAMAGMLLTDNTTFISMGISTMLVVAVAVIGSLTVLPAVIAGLGDKLDKGRIPFLGRRQAKARESRLWGALTNRVMRHPKTAAVLAGGLLVALAIPAAGMQTKLPGIESEAKSQPIIQTYLKIQEAFPSEANYAMVVVKAADIDAPKVQEAIAKLNPAAVDVNPKHTVAVVNVGLPGSGVNEAAMKGMHHLRDTTVPAAFRGVDGVTVAVSGEAAATADFSATMKSKTPIVFAFVLGLSFLLMLFSFRSIVIPIKAIVLNLLSVGASYGLLKLVFQDGHGEKLLGFEGNGAVTSWLPLFLFVILFGLSMDYHVFILSRIKEAYNRGLSTEKAVAHGIKSTAGTITSAAIIMVVVFADFATQSSLDMKQMGVGLAFAIFIDATLIRGVLLPATMKLLGDWNWYLPRWLQWIPELDHEGPATKEPKHRGLGGAEPVPSPA
jgi:RND superfamily putative drug exporter